MSILYKDTNIRYTELLMLSVIDLLIGKYIIRSYHTIYTEF